MDRTSNINLPYIMPSQAQKHVTHNEALRVLDAIVQLSVIDRTQSAPPEAAEGDRYIVAIAATGSWQDHENEIAAWQDGAWAFYPPASGWIAWVADGPALLAWDGTEWISAISGEAKLGSASINGASADNYNRLAINAPATLLNHDGNGHQLIVNKSGGTDTAAILFQTGFSGRAEFGLSGDDNWHVKVSADGISWKEALNVMSETGDVALGTENGRVSLAGLLQLSSYSVAALPDATLSGPGTMVYVNDDSEGAVVAFSDGNAWRRMTDRSAISQL